MFNWQEVYLLDDVVQSDVGRPGHAAQGGRLWFEQVDDAQ